MSSKIDFYDGRGSTAKWLGSLQDDCTPEQLLTYSAGHRALTATDPITFTDAVTTLLDEWPSIAYHPERGWPCLLTELEAAYHQVSGHVRVVVDIRDHGRDERALTGSGLPHGGSGRAAGRDR
jgi:hypothetical protein